MSRRNILITMTRFVASMLLAFAVYTIGGNRALAQCNEPGCDSIRITNTSIICVPLDSIDCVGGTGTIVSPVTSICPGATTIPCPCPNGVAAIVVQGVTINLGQTVPVIVPPGACVNYTLTTNAQGCIRIIITPCGG